MCYVHHTVLCMSIEYIHPQQYIDNIFVRSKHNMKAHTLHQFVPFDRDILPLRTVWFDVMFSFSFQAESTYEQLLSSLYNYVCNHFFSVNSIKASYHLYIENIGAISSAFLQVCVHLDDGGDDGFFQASFFNSCRPI